MNRLHSIALFGLRIALGWLLFYAGITKILDPEWSAAGYLSGAKIFTGFYSWLGSESILPAVDILNAWGLTLIGISLMLGIWVRYSALAGALLMLLYYLPQGFPYPNEHSYIVDEHVVYFFSLLLLASHAPRRGRFRV